MHGADYSTTLFIEVLMPVLILQMLGVATPELKFLTTFYIVFKDVDECALNITQCPDGQVCHNFPGGSSCLCANGRYGNNCTIRK